MAYFSTLVLAMFTTIGLVPLLTCLAERFQIMDQPNARKVHTVPVPRVGGLAMVIGMLPPIFLYSRLDSFAVVVLIGAAVIVLFAVIDDIVGLGYQVKFIGQIVAALVVIFGADLSVPSLGGAFDSLLSRPWVALPLTLLIILAVTNAINLMDGLDGLAGGMMVQVFLCLYLIASRCGNGFVALLTIAVVGAIFGFLRFNTFPASIFMGDAGSQLLGFLGIVLALALEQGSNPFSPMFPLLLFGFPVLDTAMVMGERLHRGVSPFRPDKNHFHHKLIRLGLHHREAVFVVYVIQSFFVMLAYLFRFSSEGAILGVTCAAMLLLPIPVYVCHGCGLRLRRPKFLDERIKGWLRKTFKEREYVLHAAQATVEYGLPVLFFATVVLPDSIPAITGGGSAFLLCALTAGMLMRGRWRELALRCTAYILLPLVFLQCHQGFASWVHPLAVPVYAGLYGVIICADILVLKLTRRQKGFRLTPTDFLIVGVALIVPNLPDPAIQEMHLGVWITFLVVSCFSFEVLLGELRGVTGKFELMLLPALAVLVVRGFLQGLAG